MKAVHGVVYVTHPWLFRNAKHRISTEVLGVCYKVLGIIAFEACLQAEVDVNQHGVKFTFPRAYSSHIELG